jgi:hypothetical protein
MSPRQYLFIIKASEPVGSVCSLHLGSSGREQLQPHSSGAGGLGGGVPRGQVTFHQSRDDGKNLFYILFFYV